MTVVAGVAAGGKRAIADLAVTTGLLFLECQLGPILFDLRRVTVGAIRVR